MTRGAQAPNDIRALSRTIPVFPLSGALLLPRSVLPLNIFEPRYLAMTRDALEGPKLIGMIQPTESERRNPRPDLYRVGCLGAIADAAETEDGRILLALRGLCRFQVCRELPVDTLYRQVEADYDAFAEDLQPPGEGLADRHRLLTALGGYCDRYNLPVDWESIESAPDDLLVHSLAMLCPFTAGEKQALLEAPDFAERAAMLTTLLEMALLEPSGRGRAGLRRPPKMH
ncbi:MAG TPA: LON peptidase substrate-binding domain-containing protein [Ferrovibrio sp.]|uniref:LON peptidase substrate-binding domain-containing protein n=1 Tax=Ferrovibrio sp. TaxID=1917215 RepID=UPI002ED523A8